MKNTIFGNGLLFGLHLLSLQGWPAGCPARVHLLLSLIAPHQCVVQRRGPAIQTSVWFLALLCCRITHESSEVSYKCQHRGRDLSPQCVDVTERLI